MAAIDFARFDRVLTRCAELAAETGMRRSIVRVHADILKDASDRFRSAHWDVQQAETAHGEQRAAAERALAAIDAPFRETRSVVLAFVPAARLPGTLKVQPTDTDKQNAIASLRKVLDSHTGEPWADEQKLEAFSQQAPAALSALLEAIAANIALADARHARVAAYDAAYERYLRFKQVVEDATLQPLADTKFVRPTVQCLMVSIVGSSTTIGTAGPAEGARRGAAGSAVGSAAGSAAGAGTSAEVRAFADALALASGGVRAGTAGGACASGASAEAFQAAFAPVHALDFFALAGREGPADEGQPGDAEAIEQIHAVNPATPLPALLRGPAGTTRAAALSSADAPRAAAMVADAYWNVGFTEERIARAHRGTPAWVGVRDEHQNRAATAKRRAGGRGESATMSYPLAVQLQG